MKNLNEIFREKILKVENEENKNTIVSGAFIKTDKKNSNNRIYSAEIIKREILRIQKMIEQGSTFYSGSNDNSNLRIPDVSHKINQVWFDEDENLGMVNCEILPTENGRTVQTLLKNNGSLFFSVTGTGSTETAEGIERVRDDYKLSNINISLSSSFIGTNFNKNNIVGEGLKLDKEAKLNEKELIQKYTQAKIANFKGDLLAYKERIAEPRQISDEDWEKFRQAKLSGYTGKIKEYLKI